MTYEEQMKQYQADLAAWNAETERLAKVAQRIRYPSGSWEYCGAKDVWRKIILALRADRGEHPPTPPKRETPGEKWYEGISPWASFKDAFNDDRRELARKVSCAFDRGESQHDVITLILDGLEMEDGK